MSLADKIIPILYKHGVPRFTICRATDELIDMLKQEVDLVEQLKWEKKQEYDD